MSSTIVLIGAGNMGFAMLAGWLRQNPDLSVHVVEPFEPFQVRAKSAGAHPVADLDGLPADLTADLVVLAVKPQMVESVLAGCDGLAERGASFVSVAAGITIPAIARVLPKDAPIIRCMPNTPAAIGAGMMVLCAGPNVSASVRQLTEMLFATSGALAWAEDETLIDAVTAISGSGPAYVFHFIEALTESGIALGLPADLAGLLARQTVAGAGLMAQSSADSPTVLRQKVTSPGGTTAAALAVFMADQALVRLVGRATKAARDRGIELGQEG
jgi:pyrroline-5-carboxylate reductase